MRKPNIVLLILVLVFFLGIIGMILWFLQPEEERSKGLTALLGNTSQNKSEEEVDSQSSSSSSCDPRDLSCSPWVINYGPPYCFQPEEGGETKHIYAGVIYFLEGKSIEVTASIDPGGEVRFVGEYDGKHLDLLDKKGYHEKAVDISAELSSDYQKMSGTYYTGWSGEVWRGCEGTEKVSGPFTARRCQGSDCQVD